MLADALTKVEFLYNDSSSLLKSVGAEAVFIDEKGNIC
tara:strand:- start:696 stop:809 length:114 start_codon:yes stop_codon:yes gene_type:complete